MTVTRLAVSFDRKLARAVRKAASSGSTSAWLADAAERKLRAEGLLEVVADWEKEHGAITDEDVRKAAKKLTRRPRK